MGCTPHPHITDTKPHTNHLDAPPTDRNHHYTYVSITRTYHNCKTRASKHNHPPSEKNTHPTITQPHIKPNTARNKTQPTSPNTKKQHNHQPSQPNKKNTRTHTYTHIHHNNATTNTP